MLDTLIRSKSIGHRTILRRPDLERYELAIHVDAAALPADWRNDEPSASTQALGSEWQRSGRSAALARPRMAATISAVRLCPSSFAIFDAPGGNAPVRDPVAQKKAGLDGAGSSGAAGGAVTDSRLRRHTSVSHPRWAPWQTGHSLTRRPRGSCGRPFR